MPRRGRMRGKMIAMENNHQTIQTVESIISQKYTGQITLHCNQGRVVNVEIAQNLKPQNIDNYVVVKHEGKKA